MTELTFQNQRIQVNFSSESRALLATLPGLVQTELEAIVGGTVTAFGASLLDDANAAAARTTLGLGAAATLTPAQVLAYLADPTNPRVLVDDFFAGTTETGEVGDINWAVTNGTIAPTTPEQNHPGVINFASSTTIDQVCTLTLGQAASQMIHRADEWSEQTWIFKEAVAGQTNVQQAIGLFGGGVGIAPTNGIYLENLETDTNWHFVCRASGVQHREDTGVAAGGTSWIKARFRRVAQNDIRCSINGGTEITITTNCPADATTFGIGAVQVPKAASAQHLRFDFFSQIMTALTR